MSLITVGEHDQMLRDQQRDLNRIASALEMANQLKVLELAIYHEQADYKDKESHGDQKIYDRIDRLWDMLAERNGYK